MEERFEDRVLDHLERIDRRLGRVESISEGTETAVRIQNGRVLKLEQSELARQLAEAEARGVAIARADQVLTRGQLARVAAAAGLIPTLVAAVIALKELT